MLHLKLKAENMLFVSGIRNTRILIGKSERQGLHMKLMLTLEDNIMMDLKEIG
jgi:hypothetical protein